MKIYKGSFIVMVEDEDMNLLEMMPLLIKNTKINSEYLEREFGIKTAILFNSLELLKGETNVSL